MLTAVKLLRYKLLPVPVINPMFVPYKELPTVLTVLKYEIPRLARVRVLTVNELIAALFVDNTDMYAFPVEIELANAVPAYIFSI